MFIAQPRHIHPDRGAIDHPPSSADHHPVGLVRAAKHQRRNRVAGTGKPQLVQRETGKVRLAADLDLADIGSSEALGGSLGRPSQGIEMADLGCIVGQTPKQQCHACPAA